jgi:predicted nucleic acid-binding protein
MRLVVDASVAVKWLAEEEDSDKAARLLLGLYELHAPRLLTAELGNALWRKVRTGTMRRSRAALLAAAIAEMPILWAADEVVASESVRLALELDRPVYDCVYLALAHRLGATLVTADVRFMNVLADTEHGEVATSLASLVEV